MKPRRADQLSAESHRAAVDPVSAQLVSRLARERSRFRLIVHVSQISILVVCLLLWQWLIDAGIGMAFFFSRPSDIGKFLYEAVLTGSLWADTAVTLGATLIGFVVGSVLGIGVGLIVARSPTLDAILDPYLGILNSLPRIALAPLFLLWFGLGISSKIALSISLVFFVVAINARAGAIGVPSDYITVARTLGASEWQRFVKIVVPGSVPSIFAGLRLGVVYSLLGVVTGEMIAAKAGLGVQLTFLAGTFQIAGVFGILVILAIIAVVLNWLMAVAESRLLRWR